MNPRNTYKKDISHTKAVRVSNRRNAIKQYIKEGHSRQVAIRMAKEKTRGY